MLGALEMLDGELAENGQTVKLRRMLNGAVAAEVTTKGFPSGFAIEQIGINGITEQSSKVILSPTDIIAAGWESGRPAYEDKRVPMKGNSIVIAGRVRQVESAVGKYAENGALVRIELRVL